MSNWRWCRSVCSLHLGLEEVLRRPEPVRARARARMPANSGSGRRAGAPRTAWSSTLMSARLSSRAIVDRCARCGRPRGRCPRGRSGGARCRRCQSAESLFGTQHHDVDVGARVQLAAPVAADRHQRQVAREAARSACAQAARSATSTSAARSRTSSSTGSSATKRSRFSSACAWSSTWRKTPRARTGRARRRLGHGQAR